MLQWVMDEAASRTGTDEEIATRVMLINFASIHTVALVSVLSLIVSFPFLSLELFTTHYDAYDLS